MAKTPNPDLPPRSETTLFLNNKALAVRLGKAVEFPQTVDKVLILKHGSRRVIVPQADAWGSFFQSQPLPEQFAINCRKL